MVLFFPSHLHNPMPPTQARSRQQHSSAQPSRTKAQRSSNRARNRSHSPVPRRQSKSKGRDRNIEEGSPNTLTGRELSRTLNKATEKGTQGKEM